MVLVVLPSVPLFHARSLLLWLGLLCFHDARYRLGRGDLIAEIHGTMYCRRRQVGTRKEQYVLGDRQDVAGLCLLERRQRERASADTAKSQGERSLGAGRSDRGYLSL